MRHIGLLVLFILVGCNVANQPAGLQEGGSAGNNGGNGQTIGFTISTLNRVEGTGVASIPISLSSAVTELTDINVSFSGSAIGGFACTGVEDYIVPALPITLSPGSAASVLDIVLCNDAIYEGNETIIATLNSVASYSFTSIATAVITLTDSLGVPQVSFVTASSGSVVEGAAGVTTVPVALQLSHMSTLPVAVQIHTGGLASLGTDYSLSSTTVNFAPGTNSSTVFISIFGDNIIEPNENIALGLFAPFNATFGTQTTHDLQIAQDEIPNSIQAAMAAGIAVNEVAGTQYLTVNLTGVTDHTTILNYTVDFGTAIGIARAKYPQDFTLGGSASSSGYVSVPAGATSVQIPIGIVDDGMYEPAEGILVRLLGGPEISVSAGFESALMTINTNDAANRPLVSFLTTAQSLTETNTAGGVVVRLLDPSGSGAERTSGEAVVVTIGTLAGTTEGAADWVLGSLVGGTITIPEGQTRVTIPVTIVQDGIDEDDEYFDVNLTPPAGYTAGPNTTHRVNILDVDASSRVSFQLASSSMAETAGPAAINVNVVLDKPSERTLTVNYTVGGSVASTTGACAGSSDISAPGSVTITPGLTTVALNAVLLCADTVYEGTETAIFTMTSVTNGLLGSPIAHTLSISDDEVVPDIALSTTNATPAENGGSITLTATITNGVVSQQAMIIPVTFAGTAVSGTHYTATGSAITIAAGATTGTMNIGIINNALYGGNRTLNATLGAGVWSLSIPSVAHTITEDEVLPEVGFTTAGVAVAESVGAQTATIRVNPGFASCEAPIAISLTRTGTGTYGADHDFLHPTAGIAAAGTSTNLGYNIINDLLHEPGLAETIILTITSATCNGVPLTLNPSVQTVTITDDDPAPVVGYSVLSMSVNEGAATVNVQINMDRPSSQAVTLTSDLVAYTPVPASTTDVNDPEYFKATVPGDITMLSLANVTIPAGTVSVTQSFSVPNEGIFEYPETATMQMSGVAGATLSATHNAITLTILNNSPAPYAHLSFVNDPLALSGAVSVAENVGAATSVFALLSNTPGSGGTAYTTAVPVQVPVTIAGTAAAVTTPTNAQDYTLTTLGTSGGTLTIPAGSNGTSFTITPINDVIYENVETATFNMGLPVNATVSGSFASSTMSITLDGDTPPSTTISNTYGGPIDEANTTASFVITVQPVGRQVTVNYTVGGTATAGVDHNLVAGSIIVSPSSNPQTIPVLFQIIDDEVAEPEETIIATISGAEITPVGGPSTITIDRSDSLIIKAGNGFACGLLDGNVKCWGNGQLIGQENGVTYGGPGQPVSALSPINLGTGFVAKKLAVGEFHACAVSQTGTVKCWGFNQMGQLGLDRPGVGVDLYIGDAAGEMGDNLPAVAIGEAVSDIAAGEAHTCALTVSGRLKCWGWNFAAQAGVAVVGSFCSNPTSTICIGNAPGELAATPFITPPNGGGFTMVATSRYTSCAAADDGKIYCFGMTGNGMGGRNDDEANYGEVAGDLTNAVTWKPVGFSTTHASAQVVKLSVSLSSVCAVLATGVVQEVVCWGNDPEVGQGNQLIGSSIKPLTTVVNGVSLSAFGTFDTIRTNGGVDALHHCVRGDGGDIMCWGSGLSYELGNNSNAVSFADVAGSLATDPDAEIVMLTPPGGWTDVATGREFTCGVYSHNQFMCWGNNNNSQLGMQSGNATEGDLGALSMQTF